MAHAPRELPDASQTEQYLLAHAGASRGSLNQVECKFAVASPRDGVAELFFVGGENLDALPTA